jgi:hypothetical protein
MTALACPEGQTNDQTLLDTYGILPRDTFLSVPKLARAPLLATRYWNSENICHHKFGLASQTPHFPIQMTAGCPDMPELTVHSRLALITVVESPQGTGGQTRAC